MSKGNCDNCAAKCEYCQPSPSQEPVEAIGNFGGTSGNEIKFAPASPESKDKGEEKYCEHLHREMPVVCTDCKSIIKSSMATQLWDREMVNSKVEDTIRSTTSQIIEVLESLRTMEDYDNMYCSKCGEFIKERISHHSEDGFSECCGKKLERKQGKKDDYSPENSALDSAKQLIISKFKLE